MPGVGFAPKPTSRTRHKPIRGAWKAAPGEGWQHGAIPTPPPGLMPNSVAVWGVWFRSWWASNWTAEYLPQIELAIRLWDDVERGNLRSATELRQAMDGCGISFKGQQDRRWVRAKPEEAAPVSEPPATGRYGHLRAVAAG